MDILQLIDRLEELLDSGWRVPLGNKVAIDEEAFLNIIDQMRITIPPEIKRAREVQRERDKYIAQANDEARRIIAQAREDAALKLDDHEVRKAARARSDEIVRQAQAEAARIRAGADGYAESTLYKLGAQVQALDREIVNGLEALGTRFPRPSSEEQEEASEEPEQVDPEQDQAQDVGPPA